LNWSRDDLAAYRAKVSRWAKAKAPAPIDDSERPDDGLESGLQRKCLDYCKQNGYRAFHDRSRGVNEPGWPDLKIYMPFGKTLLIELKSSAGKLRREQKQLRLELHWMGHPVYVVKSFNGFLKIIQEKEREIKAEEAEQSGVRNAKGNFNV
jgi:hypothetical protein